MASHPSTPVTTPDTDTEPTQAWSGVDAPEDDELVGTTLCDTYRIERVLGEGGMGRVYLAQHTRIGAKRFAVKTLHPELVRDAEAVARFQREAEAAAAIDSPNVVGVVDIDRAPDGRPFIVSEFLDGIELGEALAKHGPMPVGYIVPIVRLVCAALGRAHDSGVIHRDVKPENVFLTGDQARPTAKVLDFGISRLDDGRGQNLTRTGLLMGTPSYMSPEQARGEHVDHRSDVYSTGALLYAALTGKAPFDSDTTAATILSVLTSEPARPTTLVAGIPEHLELVIQKAMAKDEGDRYQTMAEMADALARYDLMEPRAAHDTLRGMPALADEAREIGGARSLLVALCLLGSTAAILGLATSARGILRFAGVSLSTLEWVLAWVALAAALSTPLGLLVRHIRREVWDNTAKVLELARALRDPLLAAAITYGGAALLVRFVEGSLLGHAHGSAWPLWDLVLLLVASVTAVFSESARRLRLRQPNLAAPKVAAVLLAAAGVLSLLVGAVAAAHGEGAASTPAPAPEPLPTASSSAPPAELAGAKPNRAGDAELQTAAAGGVQALEALARRYPDDTAVKRRLVIAHGRSEEGRGAALRLAGELFERDAAARADPAIHEVVLGGARDGGDSADLAFGLMAAKMAAHGPDLLYRLTMTEPALRARADDLLAKPGVRRLCSKALAIVLELRAAGGCFAKAQLLDRVASDGDGRCIHVLTPLMTGRNKGCGFLNLKACPATCAAEAARMRAAVQKIRARLASAASSATGALDP